MVQAWRQGPASSEVFGTPIWSLLKWITTKHPESPKNPGAVIETPLRTLE